MRDLSELWLSFAITLHEDLERNGVVMPGWSRTKSLFAKIRKEYGGLAEAISTAKVLSGVAATFLEFSKDDLEALTRSLGERRVLVIIDDIDRADPKLLPQLLLSLRELLDLPGFAFLVPFEKRIVSDALLQHHPAWGSGERFLEKILDVQVTIPQTTIEGRWAIFSGGIESIIGARPLEELKPLSDLLPDNPRRIKRLVRMFELVRQEIARHKADEIAWTSLFLGFMLKLESEDFFRDYVEATFRDGETRMTESVTRDDDRKEEAREKRIVNVIERSKVRDLEICERLKALAFKREEARVHWYDSRVIYTLRLFDLPDAFTWAEVDQLLDAWTEQADTSQVGALVARKSGELGRSENKVAKELVEFLSGTYHQYLQAAASAFSQEYHSKHIVHARKVIDRLEALLFAADIITAENRYVGFDKLLDSYGTWAHFTTNPGDAELRQVEQRLLKRLIGHAGRYWRLYSEKLRLDEVRPSRERISSFCQGSPECICPRCGELRCRNLPSTGGCRSIFEGGGTDAVTKTFARHGKCSLES